MTPPRPFSLAGLTLVVALQIPATAGAQDERAFERSGPPLTVDVTPQHIGADGTVRPVSAEHRFTEDDLVAFELVATRGGYVRLAVADEDADDGLRLLWPADPTGHPVPARQATRLPPAIVAPIKLVGKSPTEILVLFSLRPSEDTSRQRKWLEQIDFRNAEQADAPVTGPEPVRFTDAVTDGETVTMKVVLHHEAKGDGQ